MASALRVATHDGRHRRPYWRDERLMGKTFTDKLGEDVLVIGKDVWTRQELVVDLKCGNTAAARNLSKIAEKLQVESLAQLIVRYTMEDLFREEGFGIVSMYVLMCAIEKRAHKNPLDWVDRKAGEIVTLTTEKNRVHKKIEDEKKERRRKAQAHAPQS